MASHTFSLKTRLSCSAEESYSWHMRPGAIERLTPPWEDVHVVSSAPSIKDGARVVLSVPIAGPLRSQWVAEHFDVEDGRQFKDRQITGPFGQWVHTHSFIQDGDSHSYMSDEIEYALPLGSISDIFALSTVEQKLAKVFRYRHAILSSDLATHAAYASLRNRPLKIAITGGTGLIGSALIPFLTTGGHDVVVISRSRSEEPTGSSSDSDISKGIRTFHWNPERESFDDVAELDGFDAVINLAGEPIASGRWTKIKKQEIRHSRLESTNTLCKALASLKHPPKVLISASATGFYGDRGNSLLTEESSSGEGFLASVCREWEAISQNATKIGVRVVNLRLGIVLTPRGGALAKMLPPFQCGVGGMLGSGNQFMSWIALEDLIRIIYHSIHDEKISGPVNAVTPQALTNASFTKILGSVLKRPTAIPMPAKVARILFGELADEALLASQRVDPRVLTDRGFTFQLPQLEEALRFMLGR